MRRRYLAGADTGRDFITFEFISDHRANSKANKEDAREFFKRKHGHYVKILNTYLID